jgi:hypothetical protein
LGFSPPIAALRTIVSCSLRIEVYNPGFSFQTFMLKIWQKLPQKIKISGIYTRKKEKFPNKFIGLGKKSL